MKIEIEKIKVETKTRTLKSKYEAGLPSILYLPGILTKWEKIGIDMPSNENVYCIMSHEVEEWVESQPIHMWKYYSAPLGMYVFTEEMEVLFLLRWS